jgi:hypothetical protein
MNITDVKRYGLNLGPNRTVLEGRYWNSNGHAIVIVAALTVLEDGKIFDWRAYIGRGDPQKENAAIVEVAKWGNLMRVEDALHFFPELREVPYG